MNGSVDTETLRFLDENDEVYVETRSDADSPEHRTIVWVVVVEGEVFVRSVRGQKGRWYRELSGNPEGALRVGERRVPVHAVPADDTTVEAVSEAYRSKYGERWPGPTAAIVRPDVLQTTLKLSPA